MSNAYPQSLEVDINVRALDKDWTVLNLREPTAGERDIAMRELSKPNGSTYTVGFRLLAMVAGVPDAVITKLPDSLFNACVEYITGFPTVSLVTFPTTGETSAQT